MSNALYPRLALTNIFKNKTTYFPYMLTSIVCVMTSYSVTFIASNEGLPELPGGAVVLTLFFLATLVVDSFSFLLIFYTNSFLIKRRKKELGLYCVLGMEKRHVALVLLCEIFFTALICIALGLLFGVLFSRLMFLVLLYLLKYETPFAFSISVPGVVSTVILFLCIYGMTLVYDLRSLRMAKPVELLHGGEKGEKEPKASWLLTVIGLAALGGGYFIAIHFKNPIQALLLFFVAVMLVILGTFCLFTSGSIAFLKALRRSKRFYYQPNNFISVSGMMYRMKQNASGLASICILSTMVLVTVSSTVCLYAGRTDMLHSMFPREISVALFREDADTAAAQIDAALDQGLADMGLTAANRTACHSLTINVNEKDGVYKDFTNDVNDYCFSLVPESDYNRIEGVEPVSLAPNETVVYLISDFGAQDTINLGGNILRITRVLDRNVFSNVGTYDGAHGGVLVVSDEQVRPLYAALGGNPDEAFSYGAGFDVPGATPEQCAQLANRIREFTPRNVTCRSAVAQEWDSMYGCFMFLGIFFGVLFLMATVLIIYYKQISEGYEDHDRFVIMQQVGMSRREVRGAISRQILLMFFLPLGTAALHMTFAFPIIRNILLVFSLNNVGLFLACTLATFLVFAIVYILVYRVTAHAYYKLTNA